MEEGVVKDLPQTGLGGGVLYLVEEQPNPSTDYYILPAVMNTGLRVVQCGFRDLPAPAELDGAVVVFVRYVPATWAKLVEAVRPRLRALIFFMDDDVLDVHASVGMPWHYRLKLARLSAWKAGWLRRQGTELWVSVPFLLEKYAEWNPRLVLPSPVSPPSDVRRVFYHGSATHLAEVRWLRPVMEEVLRKDERISFTIVGGRNVFRLYRGIPRVTTVHPMKWPAYQHFLAKEGRHIGLAPLLDLPFNQARSYTKFFDFTRCGAVGVYSPGGECAGVVSHGVSGLVVKLDQEAWVNAILDLARNEPLRQSLLRNAELASAELAGRAQQSYAGLFKETRTDSSVRGEPVEP